MDQAEADEHCFFRAASPEKNKRKLRLNFFLDLHYIICKFSDLICFLRSFSVKGWVFLAIKLIGLKKGRSGKRKSNLKHVCVHK
jgi:hypothetical protein